MAAPTDSTPCPVCGYDRRAAVCSSCGGAVLDAPLGRPVRPGRRLVPLDIAHGFAAFWRAVIHLLTRPEYFGKLAVPVTGNAIAFALLALLGLALYGPMREVAQWGWIEALPWRVARDDVATAAVLTVVAVLLLGPALLQTIALPFVDPLADAVEKMLAGPGMRAFGAARWRSSVTNVRASAQVLAIQLALAGPCLLVSLWHLGLLLALAVAAFLNALLWFEIPFERRGHGLEQRLRVVRHNWARALGFGFALELGLLVPFVGALLLAPAAAVAATTLYFHFEKAPPAGMVRPPRTPTAQGASGDTLAKDASTDA